MKRLSKRQEMLLVINDIKLKLKTNYKWQVRALTCLYEDQTINERIDSISDHRNNVGFNSADAYILSQLAIYYNRNGYLTTNQRLVLCKKLPKYAGQVLRYIEIAKNKKEIGLFQNK